MNTGGRSQGQGPGGGDQSALSLLVNAVDSRDGARSAADSLRLRELAGVTSQAGGGRDFSFEEQLILQQQAQSGGGFGASSQAALLSHLGGIRDQQLLSQLGQQQQLASLLGLGGGSSVSSDMRQALALAQLRQLQPQISNADVLALSRSGALQSLLGGGSGGGSYGASGGLSGLTGVGGLSGLGGLGSGSSQGFGNADLESLQRLEELNRRQRFLASATEGARSRQDGVALARSDQELDSAPDPSGTDHVSKAAQDKEELEKTPGSVIVPCRARGMPMDHNFKTAYFVIPENVKHGEELICSYFACRNAGIKFRYCSHCKVPVAKRNFRKRHKHGGEAVPIKGEESGGEEDVPTKGIPSQITANREEDADADGISSQSNDSTNQNQRVSEADVQKGLVRNSMRSFEAKNKSKSKTPENGSMPKIDDDRQQRWISLLSKRPSTKDSDTMSAWLMEILAVSDLETPLNAEEEDAHKVIGKDKDTETKPSPKKTSDSPRSDAGYGSSNDDSGANHQAPKNIEDEKEKDVEVVKKKKRPSDLLKEDDPEDAKDKSDSYVSGSFAEWKERKKQRKQMKTGSPLPVVAQEEQV